MQNNITTDLSVLMKIIVISLNIKLHAPTMGKAVLIENNGPFLTVNQSMFTKVEVANQWNCRAHNNLCPTLITFVLLYTKESVLFVCDQACEQLTQE